MSIFAKHNGNRAFHADSSRRSLRNGKNTRIYWAASALRSEQSNGRYEIEKLSSSHWSISHYQVINGGQDTLSRYIGFATTKTVAVRYAELDYENLEDKVIDRLLGKDAVQQILNARAGAEVAS